MYDEPPAGSNSTCMNFALVLQLIPANVPDTAVPCPTLTEKIPWAVVVTACVSRYLIVPVAILSLIVNLTETAVDPNTPPVLFLAIAW